jgi:hypothetical protein
MILPLASVGDDYGLEFAIKGEDMCHTLVEVLKASLCSDPSTLIQNIAERCIASLPWDVAWHVWAYVPVVKCFEILIYFLVTHDHLFFISRGPI